MGKARLIFREIRLQARDIRETIAFYRDVLGFTLDTTWGPGGDPEGCILDHGDAHLGPANGASPQGRGVVWLSLP